MPCFISDMMNSARLPGPPDDGVGNSLAQASILTLSEHNTPPMVVCGNC